MDKMQIGGLCMQIEQISLCACFCDKPRFEFDEETYTDETAFFVGSGRFAYAWDDGPWHELGAGQISLCPHGVRYRRRMLSPATFALLHFRTEEPFTANAEPITPGNARRCYEDLEVLLRYPYAPAPETNSVLSHVARDLLWLAHEARPALPSAVADAYAEMAAHPEATYSVRDLAHRAGYTEAQFILLFRRHLGATPKQCLLSLRMDKAKLLLRSTPLSVSEIGERVGIADALYFSRLFRRRTGVTPREYRKLGLC